MASKSITVFLEKRKKFGKCPQKALQFFWRNVNNWKMYSKNVTVQGGGRNFERSNVEIKKFPM